MRGKPVLPPLAIRCEECGRHFEDTREMLEVGEGVYVHTHECEGFPLDAGVAAPLAAVFAVLGAPCGFLAGLWIFARVGWLWPVALLIAVAACWLAVLAIGGAEGGGS